MMRRVILESPYSGDIDKHLAYARRCMKDCLARNKSPLASHLLYTQVLRDDNPSERELGIAAGLTWGAVADATVVYTDHGISDGMRCGMWRAHIEGRPVEYRRLHPRKESNKWRSR